MDHEELLARTSIANGLRGDQLAVLGGRPRWRSANAGKALLDRADAEFPLIVLLEGEAEVRGMFGQDVSPLRPGSLIGEIAFLDRGPRTADVVAKTPVRLAILPHDLLDWLHAEHPDLAAKLLLNLGLTLCAKLRWAQRLIDAGDASRAWPDR